jgi:hypothetical protein
VKSRFQPKLFLAFIAVCGLLGLALSYFTGLSYWWAAAIVAGSLLANGLLAEFEDRSSGGFLNPNGESRASDSTPREDA